VCLLHKDCSIMAKLPTTFRKIAIFLVTLATCLVCRPVVGQTSSLTSIFTTDQEGACPLLTCCENDCCDAGTSWTGSWCGKNLTSPGWQPGEATTAPAGCAVQQCCEASCCGTETFYNSTEGCCQSCDENFTVPELTCLVATGPAGTNATFEADTGKRLILGSGKYPKMLFDLDARQGEKMPGRPATWKQLETKANKCVTKKQWRKLCNSQGVVPVEILDYIKSFAEGQFEDLEERLKYIVTEIRKEVAERTGGQGDCSNLSACLLLTFDFRFEVAPGHAYNSLKTDKGAYIIDAGLNVIYFCPNEE